MKTIRPNTFETNSSSSHSVTISPCGPLVMEGKFAGECIRLTGGEFGWENETYSHWEDKLRYLVAHAMSGSDASEDPEQNPRLQMLIEAIKQHTGADSVFAEGTKNGFWKYGYIDHQSWDVAQEVYDGGINDIINFVFNAGSELRTGNDNDW